LPAESYCSVEKLVSDGIGHIQNREYQKALEDFHEAESRALRPADIWPLIGLAYLGVGQEHLQAGRYIEAKMSFDEGLKFREDDTRVWFGLAIASFHLGRLDDSESAVLTAIAMDSSQIAFYELLSKIHYANGRLRKAIDTLEQASAMPGSDKNVQFLEKLQREWEVEKKMAKEHQGLFELSFVDEGQSELIADILEVLNDAYRWVGAELDFFPEFKIPVLLYSRQDFNAVTLSPDWAGAVYDGKIRIPLGGLSTMTPKLKALLFHEYAHVLIDKLGNSQVPTWINEGYAEVCGRQHFDPPVLQLKSAAQQNQLLSWTTLSESFMSLPTAQVPLAYEQSYSMVLFLIENFGSYPFKELLILTSKNVPLKVAFETSYGDYGVNWETIENEWRNSIH
jgi:tetratricopeptide (TPR) repeat protein